MTDSLIPPGLEPRFLPPEGWRWHTFTHDDGRELRYGSVAPKNSIPDAVVIGLQGLNEFGEKYFEVARTLLDRNMSFWMMDWYGQGKSGRYLTDPEKRHAGDFERDVDDLHYFIMEYVLHSSVHPDVGRIPLIMVGHSMGTDLGIRFLQKYPKHDMDKEKGKDIFTCAAMTAPLCGIRLPLGLHRLLPLGAQEDLVRYIKEFLDTSYVPRKSTPSILSGDPVRSALASHWLKANPDLGTDGATWGWLYEALRSCAIVNRPGFLKSIQTPVLMALAGKEDLVDNKASRRVAAHLPHCELLELPEARHEILMETSEIRNEFFNRFYKFLKDNDIKSKLTPF